MQTRPAAIERCLHADSVSRDTVSRDTVKFPLHAFAIICRFPQTPEDVLLSIVPEHGFAKDQSERHLVDQSFQSGRWSAGGSKVCMSPRPEVAMPVSTVVSLYSECQRLAGKTSAIESDLP